MKASQRTIKFIRGAGATLLVLSAVPLAWALYNFATLPNYLRLAAFVPFAFGVPLFSVNNYFDGWSSLPPRQKGHAVAWLLIPFVILAGALYWYMSAPTARA